MEQVKVVWAPIAAGQFEDAIIYVADQRGKVYAERARKKVFEATRNLSKFPQIGRREPSLEDLSVVYRYWVVWNHKLIYRYDELGNKIVIVRFFHTSQNPDRLAL